LKFNTNLSSFELQYMLNGQKKFDAITLNYYIIVYNLFIQL